MKIFVISDKGQLQRLLSAQRVPDFRLQLTHLSLPENRDWETKLRKEYFACGCQTGAAFLLAALAGLLVLVASDWLHYLSIDWNWKNICGSLGVIFGAAVVGKLMGQFRARSRLKKKLTQLTLLLSAKNA